MKKRIFSAMVVTLLAISCNQEEGLKQVVNSPESGSSAEIVELFDGDTEKAYHFSFSDLYTPYVTYTHEISQREGVTTVGNTRTSGRGLLIKAPSINVVPL